MIWPLHQVFYNYEALALAWAKNQNGRGCKPVVKYDD